MWERIAGGLTVLDRLVDGDARDALHGRVAALVGPARAELGADAGPGEDDRTRTLRGVLLQAAALLGDDVAARDRAADLLDRFLAHPPSVDPSLASPALAVCATLGDVAAPRAAGRRASASAANPQDRAAPADLADPLPRPRGPAAHARADACRATSAPRTPPTCSARRSPTATTAPGPGRSWPTTGPRSSARFPANSLSRLVGGIRSVRDRALADEITAFLAEHPIPQGDMQVRQHVERMGVTVALAEREAARLTSALTT